MVTHERPPAALLLEDGTVFRGRAYGAIADTAGEVVFNTAMSGYQEILTDPSYRAQIVVMTHPHIGSTGINPEDMESDRAQPAGFIVRAPIDTPSSYRSTGSLEAWLRAQGVVGLCGVDTRALVRRIRSAGVMRGAILPGTPALDVLQARLDEEPPMTGRDLVREVTCAAPYIWREDVVRLSSDPAAAAPPTPARHVVAIDCGIKRNILRLLVAQGCEVTVVPATFTAAEVMALRPDGVFLSNGPGDPAALDYAVETVRGLIGQRPLFGICLGHQLIARALGADTFKLPFGHRGANQPVRDAASGRVEITSQNHGFAVDPAGLPADVEVSFTNLNDATVAGLTHRSLPVFSVQSHPEASPGPHDSAYLFGRFRALMDAA